MKLAGRKFWKKKKKPFNNASWEEAIVKLKEKIWLETTVGNSKNKYRTSAYTIHKSEQLLNKSEQLLRISGFEWDDTLKMVTTVDEVWENLE